MLEQKNYGIGVIVNPGLLDTPITLKKVNSTAVNSYNEETITYDDVSIMAYFKPLSGTESTVAGKETTFLKGRFIIRYYPGLTTRDYIVHDGDDWDIETAEKYGKKGMYHMINARKVI